MTTGTSPQLSPVAARLAGLPLSFADFAAVRSGRALSEPLSLEVPAGSVVGLLGPNGAGKSSLLAAIAQAGVASRGRCAHGGLDLGALRPRERAQHLALLPQDLAAPAEFLVHELVAVGARAAAHPDPATAVATALERAGIADLAQRRFGTLSGGQRQLSHLARVLAQDTPIVLLDEPTSALDLAHQRAVEHTIRRLAAEGRTVVTALHDLSLALNVCSTVLLLDRDGAALSGPPQLVLHPDHLHRVYGVRTETHRTPSGRAVIVPTELD
ncbi:probable iron ABC transporter, ATP-binding protein [Leucobacter sp. 7(1)]|uniref:ABC transporter ATP-binding protein n=1 Tax=Leucobacter sp. 7(1) TaxID=1255613 RepID=UPI00097E7DAD|nr:ABC transporter ATP-binding protein [Leucobacter sp. 7(1)]SJN08218.1 probable iron ABC transporter, ATP-binding protein [Leucobacter sp. 7(1)]